MCCRGFPLIRIQLAAKLAVEVHGLKVWRASIEGVSALRIEAKFPAKTPSGALFAGTAVYKVTVRRLHVGCRLRSTLLIHASNYRGIMAFITWVVSCLMSVSGVARPWQFQAAVLRV